MHAVTCQRLPPPRNLARSVPTQRQTHLRWQRRRTLSSVLVTNAAITRRRPRRRVIVMRRRGCSRLADEIMRSSPEEREFRTQRWRPRRARVGDDRHLFTPPPRRPVKGRRPPATPPPARPQLSLSVGFNAYSTNEIKGFNERRRCCRADLHIRPLI